MLSKYVPFQSFMRDERGTIVQLFALTLVGVCGFIGLGIDGGRAYNAYSKAGAALDSAALAAARELMQTGASDAELLTMATQYFETNTEQGGGLIAKYENVQVDVERGDRTFRVQVSADVKVPTTFAQVIGFDTFEFSNSATVRFEVKEIELGMALDVTGSMGGQKLADLKVASKELIDLLLPEDAVTEVSIGIAPYAGAVRIPNPPGNRMAERVSNELSTGCVVDRNTDRYTDYTPSITSYYLTPFNGMQNRDSGQDYQDVFCPQTEAVGLTRDKERLHDVIDDLKADGFTAGQLGTTWAWNIVSPNYAGLWPDSLEAKPYGGENLVKAVILMTDGGFNTAFAGSGSTVQAKAMCDAMKDQDIIIYTVSFQSPNHPALRYCATTDSSGLLYFEADNATELQQAFRNIAAKLNNLRIAQ